MNALPANIDVSAARLPATYEQAKTALASCARIDECQTWADKAAALASYAKMANDDALMKMATRIRDRAIRRAGELLKQIEPARGANQNIGVDAHPNVETRKQAAADAGLSPHQAKQAKRLASIPLDDFENQVESDSPPTVTQLAQQGIQRPAPKPLVDLQGRDPGEFNRSLHFVAEVRQYAAAIAAVDLDLVLPGLSGPEERLVSQMISEIDAVHDRIMTRII